MLDILEIHDLIDLVLYDIIVKEDKVAVVEYNLNKCDLSSINTDIYYTTNSFIYYTPPESSTLSDYTFTFASNTNPDTFRYDYSSYSFENNNINSYYVR